MDTYRLDALGALADPTRRRVFEQLLGGPLAVHEIAATMPVSRPAVSQHLRVLVDAGLVSSNPSGTRRVYAVRPEGLDALRKTMDGFWSRALAGFQEVASAAASPPSQHRRT